MQQAEESLCHQLLSERKVAGEWFHTDDLLYICSWVEARFSVKNSVSSVIPLALNEMTFLNRKCIEYYRCPDTFTFAYNVWADVTYLRVTYGKLRKWLVRYAGFFESERGDSKILYTCRPPSEQLSKIVYLCITLDKTNVDDLKEIVALLRHKHQVTRSLNLTNATNFFLYLKRRFIVGRPFAIATKGISKYWS